jgi:hypothetical protein
VPSDAELHAALAEQESRPGDGVSVYAFEKGEEVPADHVAVLAFPHLFEPAEE